MQAEQIIEVIEKLVGKIEPQGESHIDCLRYENLKVLCEVVRHFEEDIFRVTRHTSRYEASMKHAGEYADKFIKETLEYYGEI